MSHMTPLAITDGWRGCPVLPRTAARVAAPPLSVFSLVFSPRSDIYLLTGIPLQHLYKMACHLVYWKCAMIINVITGDSIFTFNPNPSIPICSPPVTLTQKFLKDCSDSPDHIDNPLNVLLRCPR